MSTWLVCSDIPTLLIGSVVNELLAFVCPNVLMPALNLLLAKGIALPSIAPQLKLTRAELSVGAGYLLIGGDLEIDASIGQPEVAVAGVSEMTDASDASDAFDATVVDAIGDDGAFELVGGDAERLGKIAW